MSQKEKYKWFANVRRFRNKAGRFVAQGKVTDYVDQATANFAKDLKIKTQKMLDNFSEERFAAWATETKRSIRNMHNAVTIIALGGKKAAIQFSAANAQAWAEAEALTAKQMQFFDQKMFKAAVGVTRLDGAFVDQIGMYGEAGFNTYQNAVRLREFTAGMDEEKREQHSAVPCIDCTVEASKDWQPMGTLRRIGDSRCGGRCRCRFLFRKVKA